METVHPNRRYFELAAFAFAAVLLFVALTVFVYTALPVHQNADPPRTWGFSVDWKGCIRPDVITTMRGGSPYAVGCGLNPPWTYLLLSPIALLEPATGAAVLFVLTYFGYFFMLYRLRVKTAVIGLFLLNPLVLQNAINGNIDWLAVIGYGLPAPVGLFFVMMKPQLGIGIALFWLVEAWREGRIRAVVKTFAPVTAAYLISFIFYGLWPLGLTRMPNDPFNSALFPMGIPFGGFLLWLALRKRNVIYAIAASPFFAPYVNIHSYAVTTLAITGEPVAMSVLLVFMWVLRRGFF